MENNPWHISLGRGPIGPKRKKIIARPWPLQKTTLPLKLLLSTYIVFLVIVPYCRGQDHNHNHNGDRQARLCEF